MNGMGKRLTKGYNGCKVNKSAVKRGDVDDKIYNIRL